MVNISKYTIVAIGDNITSCEKSYRDLLKSNNITNQASPSDTQKEGIIKKISEAVIDGNSHYYILFEDDAAIYDVTVGEHVGIIRYNVGDKLKVTYIQGETVNTVTDIIQE